MKKLLLVFCLAIVSVALAATPTITKSIGKYPLGDKHGTWALVQKGGPIILVENARVVNEDGQVSVIIVNGKVTEQTDTFIIIVNCRIDKEKGKISFTGGNRMVEDKEFVRIIIENGSIALLSNGIIVVNGYITKVGIIDQNFFK
ncbi:unnamed protein product [marine sediment metagenome]|uniref:Uncharacterized protein n=1 Tax=marine sediment metagenome TaxID=412755 RepID=X1CF39_9ZZZZ